MNCVLCVDSASGTELWGPRCGELDRYGGQRETSVETRDSHLHRSRGVHCVREHTPRNNGSCEITMAVFDL